jgi:periplasmic protein TonB
MRWWTIAGCGLSLIVHVGLSAGIGSIPKTRPPRKVSTVKMFDAKPAKKKAAEEEQKPAKVDEKPKPPPPPKNTPPPAPTAATPPTPQATMAALPDFGLSLGGGVEGGGIAIPVAGMAANAANANSAANRGAGGGPAEKRVRAAAPKPSEAADGCIEEPTKPKAVEKVQPQYVDEARAANVEGVVKVEFRVGADGEVLEARVIQGLGHGLDQAAVAAAKRWKFNPALRCGKPVESRHVVSMRFQLGD